MNSLAKITLAVALLCSSPVKAAEFVIGAQAGMCSTSVYLEMCDESRLTWHVYAEVRQALTDGLYLTSGVHHFSSFDGSADLAGDTDNQSGVFDYIGAGVEWRF